MSTENYGPIEILDSDDGKLVSLQDSSKPLTDLVMRSDDQRSNYYKHTIMIKMDIFGNENAVRTRKFDIHLSAPSLSFAQDYLEDVQSSESGISEALRVLAVIEGQYKEECADKSLQIQISENGDTIRELSVPLTFEQR